MGFLGYFLLFNAAMILLFILEGLNRKWFAIDEAVLESAPAKKINLWSFRAWSFGLFPVLLILLLQDVEVKFLWLAGFFTALTGVKVYFEWKLLKGSRKYRMTLVTYVFAMLFLFFTMRIS